MFEIDLITKDDNWINVWSLMDSRLVQVNDKEIYRNFVSFSNNEVRCYWDSVRNCHMVMTSYDMNMFMHIILSYFMPMERSSLSFGAILLTSRIVTC